jgi:hypothetical protein
MEPPAYLYEGDEDVQSAPAPSVAPPEETEAEVAPLASGDELEQLRQLWPRLCEQISARSRPIGSAFRNPALVRPFAVKGSRVIISFRDPIQRTRSQGEPHRSIIEGALTRVLGHKCVLESILFSEEETGGPPTEPFSAEMRGRAAPKEKKTAPHETTRGRAAMNIFGITKFDD